ncbi:MAG: phospholipid/cholesterol/gamma-HCH transport system substrate-binding protein [Actinomycetota bacterium]|jgi:virulence factor Mce-like protein|nr:phospholipid/cholesterol/gamma-HCH transport system substrate-binding protein [Actinomycetota bacterium]
MPKALVSLITGFVIVGAIAVAAVFVTDDAGGYTITADVDQAPSLFEKGRVMVRGVEVGRITAVEPRRDSVRLTMTIQEGISLPADAHLSIVPITVIADRYVQISPPYAGGEKLADGAHIALEDTTIPAELDDVLAQLRGLLAALEPRHGNPGPLAELIDNLDAALKGKEDALAGTVEGGAEVLGNLAASEAQLTGLIDHLDTVFVALADRSSEIGLINERLNLVVQALASDSGHLQGTIQNIAFLSQEASGLVSESGDELGVALGRLDTVLSVVLDHETSLAQGMKWTNVIAQALGETDSSGKGLWAYSGRQAAPGSAASMYNYRIDTRDSVACERIGLLAERFLQINPDWGFDEVRHAVLSYIPEDYHDDLAFIIDLLIPLCADLPNEPSLAARADSVIARAMATLGPKATAALVDQLLPAVKDGKS